MSRRLRVASLVLALGLLGMAGQASAEPKYTTVFEDDFGAGAKPQWSARTTSTTPKGDRHLLGEFGAQTVTLSLEKLPPHKLVKVSFDLLIIRSWDGNSPQAGPDIFNVVSGDGRPVFRSTLAVGNLQAYPGIYGIHSAPALTGAAEKFTMGYRFMNGPMDAVFHIECVFPDAGADLALHFVSQSDTNIQDESWGLSNVRLSVADETWPLSEDEIPALLKALGGQAIPPAMAAMQRLISSPDDAVLAIAKEMADAELPPEVATCALGGVEVGPHMIRQGGQFIDQEQDRRIAMMARILQIIGTSDATDVLAAALPTLPAVTSTLEVTVVDRATHKPIPMAAVTASNNGYFDSAITDPAGKVKVYYPTAGPRIGIMARAPKYVQPLQYMGNVVPAVALAQGKYEVSLDQGMKVSGRLVDEAGAPIAGGSVIAEVRSSNADPDMPGGPRALAATTDSEGKWSIDGIASQYAALSLGGYHPLYGGVDASSGSLVMQPQMDPRGRAPRQYHADAQARRAD